MLDFAATVRHTLATLNFRTMVSLRDAPDGFGDFDAGHGAMKPAEILRHMAGLVVYLHATITGTVDAEIARFRDLPAPSWAAEVSRFQHAVKEFDATLAARGWAIDDDAQTRILWQGPMLDAFTHAGQLAMLRRLAGSPIPAVSYRNAPIAAGRFDA